MSVTAVPLQPVKRSYKTWLWAGLVLAIAIAVALAWRGTQYLTEEQLLNWNKHQSGVETTASGLQYKVLTPGTGPAAAEGDGAALVIHGVLTDGKEFQPETPMRMQVGQPMIPGFTEGVKLMKKGAKYRFWVPPSLGYGAPGAPPSPLSKKVLVFDVEMTELIPAQMLQQMMMQQQLQQQQGGAPGGPPPGGPEGGQ